MEYYDISEEKLAEIIGLDLDSSYSVYEQLGGRGTVYTDGDEYIAVVDGKLISKNHDDTYCVECIDN